MLYQVSIEDEENYAKKYDIKFFEASAKDGTNVNELFFHLANEIYQDYKLNRKNESKIKLSLGKVSSNNTEKKIV